MVLASTREYTHIARCIRYILYVRECVRAYVRTYTMTSCQSAVRTTEKGPPVVCILQSGALDPLSLSKLANQSNSYPTNTAPQLINSVVRPHHHNWLIQYSHARAQFRSTFVIFLRVAADSCFARVRTVRRPHNRTVRVAPP